MAYTFKVMIDKLKKEPKRIVFTEGSDPRILEAASRLLASNFLTPILLGKVDEVEKAAEVEGFNIRGAVIIDPENYDKMDEMVDMFCEIRKSKGMTPEKARPILSKGNYFGTMLIKMGEAYCLLGGATYSTADTVRPALQIIKTKPGNKIVSSCFILVRPAATGDNMVLAMADCAINIKPNEDELVEIARETVNCAKVFGVDPKVAFARTKCPNSPVAGYANTFIFPDINAGNIGYKIAQRLGNFDAYGPILLGLNAQINDLSRGCNAQEVYSMAIITAALA